MKLKNTRIVDILVVVLLVCVLGVSIFYCCKKEHYQNTGIKNFVPAERTSGPPPAGTGGGNRGRRGNRSAGHSGSYNSGSKGPGMMGPG